MVCVMTYTIYGDLGSGAFSAEAALAEAGADYAFHTVSLERNEQRKPAYLAINPSGKMPALKLPSGEIVTESLAIVLTIAERFARSGLLPADLDERAQALRWLSFMASEIYPMVEISDYPDRFVPMGDAAKALKLKAQERIRERLLIIENALAGPWILECGFTAADLYAAMILRWRATIGREWLEDGHVPKLLALRDAVAARPRIAPIWARHFPN